MMSSGDTKLQQWNVFEGVKRVSIAPEALMAEINSAISALEYARSASSSLTQSRTTTLVSKSKTLVKG